MAAPADLIRLVDQFREHQATYMSGEFNEAALRIQFIDPMFELLGWDVYNRQGFAEAYKHVVHEDTLKIGGSTKAPDYSFRVGGVRKFFVEAKKPSVKIKDAVAPAFQLRRYAWSAKLPLSILTDFEEFAVYDCRVRPQKTDGPATARTMYLTFDQYEDRWDEIASIFSLDAIQKGSFDKYADSTKKKRGTAEVDTAFLDEIESWRSELARNLALRNKDLPQRELNEAVQKTIDRIVFLRMCEDRGIEPYGRLQPLLNGSNVYARLGQLFRDADDRYNSGLFHFSPDKDRQQSPDEWTLALTIDDGVLKEIIRKLYYPESPYEFSVLPADILGQVYEQFLGKVIRLTAGHRAVVEDKPEVKKAGGVFYTPTYIVDHIVQNTIGKLLEDKTAYDVATRTPTWKPAKGSRPLSVLDPACGSGSFLIGAYQYLLDWYRDWFVANDPVRHKSRIYQNRQGHWRLTTAERKRILVDHIYGVDIDPQAVEVTKLSLLLKVLEAETKESIESQRRLFHQRALPDLANNIKCGNSLIGPDFYRGKQLDLFDPEERMRINVFDWQTEFSETMQSGGFDAVIGNPPYIRIQAMKEWAPVEVDFYKQQYQSASQGNYDIYVVFVERGLTLLNPSGLLGFILPHKFFGAQYGTPLRTLLTKGRHLAQIVHFGSQQVFTSATTYTCLLFLTKRRSRRCRFVQVDDLEDWIATGQGERGELLAEEINGIAWNIQVGPAAKVMKRLTQSPVKLKDVTHLFVGLQTDADDVFILEEVKRQGAKVLCASRATGENHWFEADHLKPFLKGSLDIRRYGFSDAVKYLIFPYRNTAKGSRLIPEDEYAAQYPLTWEYLLRNRPRLAQRAKGTLGSAWYGYVYKKNHLRFEQPKILAPAIAAGACFAWDKAGSHYFVGSGGGGGGGYGIVLQPESDWTPLYLLGLLNSNLVTFWLKRTSTVFRGGYLALNRQYIEEIPLVPPASGTASRPSAAERIHQLVEQMLALHAQTPPRTEHEKSSLSRQIAATDDEIDQLVYELYGLTDDEIRIVEQSTTAVSK